MIPPNLVAKIDHLNHHELPATSGMAHTDATGPEYHRAMLDELHAQAVAGSAEALWALEMITTLHELYGKALDAIQGALDALEGS